MWRWPQTGPWHGPACPGMAGSENFSSEGATLLDLFFFCPHLWPVLCPEEEIALLEGPLFLASPILLQLSASRSFQSGSIAAPALLRWLALTQLPDVLCTSITHSVGFLPPFHLASFLLLYVLLSLSHCSTSMA